MIDRRFLDEMEKLQLEVMLTKGPEIEALMTRLYALPQATVTKMRAAISVGGR